MLKFIVEIKIMADAPENEDMKNIFMKNAEDVIQQGLERMTVPDWIANVVDIIEEEDEFFL